MLDRLETALERERAFVDDASHELRTPLAAHKAELEIALRYGASSDELRAAITSAIEEADRLSQLAEDLLVIARSDKDGLALKLERIDVPDLFETVRSRLSSRAERDGRPLVECFRQADTARSTDGTGLGLAIVQAIAQAHGGRAMAGDANGRGADVWIELSIAEPPPESS